MGQNHPCLLVIGLDGGTFAALTPLLASGVMPNLAGLMERGCWGELASTIPPFTGAAWSSFATGYNPGRHGILSFRGDRDRFNYEVVGSGFVDARRFDVTIWDMIGAYGKRVGIVNVPLTYPPRPINGYMVTGMLTPPNATPFTYPPELAERLDPDYAIDVDFIRDEAGFRATSPLSRAETLSRVRQVTEARIRATTRLLQEEPADVFMVVFTGTDRVFHFFWDDLQDLIEAESPRNEIQRGIQDYFQALDRAIGDLVRLAGASTPVLVISDHGFGPAQTRRFYANVWLESLGLLQRRASDGILDLEYWRVRIGRNERLKRFLRRLIPQSAQDRAKSVTESVSKDILAWSKTQAFFVPIYFHVGGVEINRAGIHREGAAMSGTGYEALRDRIIREARALRDPERATPIVEVAARREDLYDGPYVDQFPDVILVLDPDYIGGTSVAGSSIVEPHAPLRPGEHREEGMFVAAGPGIRAQADLPDLNLLDIPPTMFYALGLPVPPAFDGRVLSEIFTPDHLARHPVSIEAPPSEPPVTDRPSPGDGYSEEEEQALGERLRGLGYLE